MVMLARIGKVKQVNELMTHGIGKLWAIYKRVHMNVVPRSTGNTNSGTEN